MSDIDIEDLDIEVVKLQQRVSKLEEIMERFK